MTAGGNTLEIFIDFSDTAETSNLYFDDALLGGFDYRTFAAANEGIDVADYLRSGTVTRGAQRVDGPLVRFDAGHATITLDNRDARFDPTNITGPYAAAGVSQVTPMRKVWIVATNRPMFTGYVDSWTLNYPAYGNDATVTLSATDGTKVLAAFDGPAQAAQGAGETTHARLERIAAHVGFPAEISPAEGRVAIAERLGGIGGAPTTTCQATTLAGNAWTEMLLTADTDMGGIYFDGQGRLTTFDRYFLYEHNAGGVAPSIASQVFGDGAGEDPYTAIDITYDDQRIYNDISISRTGGTAQTAENAASQTRYLVHTYGRTDLVHETDAASQLHADYLLALCKDPAVTVNSITRPIDTVYSVQYNHPYWGFTVKLRPPGGGVISRRCITRGFQHTFDPSGIVTQIFFEDAERYRGFVFDSATNGILDTNWFLY